jgi:hypothetical protein
MARKYSKRAQREVTKSTRGLPTGVRTYVGASNRKHQAY